MILPAGQLLLHVSGVEVGDVEAGGLPGDNVSSLLQVTMRPGPENKIRQVGGWYSTFLIFSEDNNPDQMLTSVIEPFMGSPLSLQNLPSFIRMTLASVSMNTPLYFLV